MSTWVCPLHLLGVFQVWASIGFVLFSLFKFFSKYRFILFGFLLSTWKFSKHQIHPSYVPLNLLEDFLNIDSSFLGFSNY